MLLKIPGSKAGRLVSLLLLTVVLGACATGTIRDLFGASLSNNAVHASANTDDAARELGLIFG